jgi:plastocyanin
MNFSQSTLTKRARIAGWMLPLIAIATLLLSACGGSASTTSTPTPQATTGSQATTGPATASAAVKIVESSDNMYAFQPNALTIKVGTTVVWTNTSDAAHTVTSDTAGVFGTTTNLTMNQTFSFTFTKAGTFPYHCNIHAYMKATITVTG